MLLIRSHSAQALLDVYTIQREIGRLENLRIGLVGDLANGRTVRSLAYLLSMYKGIKFYFVAPDVVRMQACPFSLCPAASPKLSACSSQNATALKGLMNRPCLAGGHQGISDR